MNFIDHFNEIFFDVVSTAFVLVGRLAPFVFCVIVFLFFISKFVGWIRWRFIWHCKDVTENDET